MSLITTNKMNEGREEKNYSKWVCNVVQRIIFYLHYLKNEFYSHLDTSFLLLLFTQPKKK